MSEKPGPGAPAPSSVTSSRDATVGFLWLSTTQVVQIILFLGFTILLARLLTPYDFGVMAATTLVLSLIDTVSTLGFGPALVQKDSLSRSHSGSALTVSILLSLLLAATLVALAPVFASIFRIPALQTILRLLAFLVPLTALTTISQSMLQRHLRFRALALTDLIPQAAATALVAIPLAAFGFGYWSLVIAAAMAAIAKTVTLVVLASSWLRPGLCLGSIRELLVFSVPYTGTSILDFAATRFDQFIIVRVLGEASLGLFNRIAAILNPLIAIVGSSSDRVLFPMIAQHQHEEEYLARSYCHVVRLSSLVCIPLSMAIALHSRSVTHLLLGSQWHHASIPLAILAFALYFRIGHRIADTFHRALGLVSRQTAIYAVHVPFVIGLTLAGIRWGLTGAVGGLSLAVIIHFLLLTSSLWFRLDLRLGQIGRSHLAGLPLGILVLVLSLISNWMTGQLSLPSYLSVLVFTALSLLLSVLALMWIRRAQPSVPIKSVLRSFISGVVHK